MDRDAESMASMQCHDEIKVCRECIGWLGQRAGLPGVTPILAVHDMGEVASFYEAAGFAVERYDDGYAFVEYADTSVFDLGVEQVDPSTNRGSCYIIVTDPDSWHQRLSDAGLPVSAIEDQDHGMREFTLVDPSGNRLRIGRSV